MARAASPDEPGNHSKNDDEEDTLLSIILGNVVDYGCRHLGVIDMSIACGRGDGDGDPFILRFAFEARMRC